MKKILFIHHATGWGGSTVSLINTIKCLDHRKYTAEVLLLKDSIVTAALADHNIRYRIADSIFYKKLYEFFPHSEAGYIKWYQFHNFIFISFSWILSRYFFSKKQLLKHEFDIVHLNSSVLTDWLAPAKKEAKVIIHIREPFRKGKMDILHPIFKSLIRKHADGIIAISKDNARRISIPNKTVVIYNFSEDSECVPSEISYTSKEVLYLGGSGTSKGFYTISESLDYLDKDVKILFGGKYVLDKKPVNPIQYLRYILSKSKKRKSAIKRINNHPNAVFIGLVQNTQDYMKKICCLISPFTVPHFPRPVIEAHLNRKPVIASNVEGMEEVVRHEENGLIVPKNDPKALAEAINTLTSNSQKAKAYGESGYKIAQQKFTSKNSKELEKLYDQLFL